MKWNVSLLMFATVVAGSQVGCDKAEPTAGPGAGPTPAASTIAAPKPVEVPKVEAPKVEAKATTIPVTDFLAKIAPTGCNFIDQCKNEKIKAFTATMGMMIAGFGSLDKPDLAKQMKTVGDDMKKDKRSLPNKQECGTIVGVVLQIGGMTPEVLQPKIGKTVQYDGEKAAACFAAIDAPFAPCATEVKVTGEPKLSEIDAFQKEFGTDFENHTKACGAVFTGMVEAGATCEYDFECKGENSKCKGGAGKKKCEAAKAKK